MKKTSLRLTLALSLALGVTSTSYAAPLFDNMFFFGDSLTDMGNNIADGAPVTTPGGSTWANYFANKFGYTASPSTTGGNDYAYAGAETGSGIIDGVPGMITQLNTYLSNHAVDSRALYSLWGGSNDLNDQIPAFIEQFAMTHGFLPSAAQIAAFAGGVAGNVVANINTMVGMLHADGAKYIMVFNLPDLGATPAGQSSGIAPILTNTTHFLNQSLLAALNADGFDIIQIDINSLFNDVVADPQHFGLANANALYFTPAGGNPALDEHPSAYGHEMIADYVFSVVEGPALIATLAEAPISVMDAQNLNLETQLYNVRNCIAMLCAGQTSVFGSSSYTDFDQYKDGLTPLNGQVQEGTQNVGFDGHSTDVTAGVLHRLCAFNGNLVIGAAIAYSFGHADFGENLGGFDISDSIGSLLASYQYNKYYADGIVNVGILNFDNVVRNIPIGVSQNSARGDTSGLQFGGNLILGYNIIQQNDLKTGPILTNDYQYIQADSYSDSGNITGIGESFDNQTNNWYTTGIGWQAAYTFALNRYPDVPIMPFAQITYNHQWLSGKRRVGAGLTSLPGSHFTIPVSAPDGDFGLVNAGVSTRVWYDVTLSAGYQSTLFFSGGHSQSVDASIQIPL